MLLWQSAGIYIWFELNAYKLHYDVHSISQNLYIVIQKYGLFKNIERLSFWSVGNRKLHFDKRELLAQINNLSISIDGIGFFKIDRQFLVRVSSFRTKEYYKTWRNMVIIWHYHYPWQNLFLFSKNSHDIELTIFIFRWPQLLAHTSSSSFSFIYLRSI